MKEIVSPSMNVPYCIEKHLRANNSSTNELVFCIRFAPVDLITNHDHRTVPYNIPDGLKRLYKSDMDKFLSKIKLISQLRENEDLSYKLPDFHDISLKDGICSAEYSYYEGITLDKIKEIKLFFHALSSLMSANSAIVKITREDIGIPPECIIFEPDNTSTLHYLFLDNNEYLTPQLREYIASCITDTVFGKSCTFRDKVHGFEDLYSNKVHPVCRRMVIQLLHTVLPVRRSINDWEKAAELCKEIRVQLDKNKDYLIRKVPDSEIKKGILFDKIREGFTGGCHIQFISSSLKNEALWFAYNSGGKYVHIAEGNAENGIRSMLDELEFASGDGDKMQKLKEICGYPTLLIIENCAVDNDELFPELLKLSADILIITDEDYSDYGFTFVKGE